MKLLIVFIDDHVFFCLTRVKFTKIIAEIHHDLHYNKDADVGVCVYLNLKPYSQA